MSDSNELTVESSSTEPTIQTASITINNTDDATSNVKQQNDEEEQLTPVGKLFFACIRGNIELMKEIIERENFLDKFDDFVDIEYEIKLFKFGICIPLLSYIRHKRTQNLLHASVLSNSIPMIEYVIDLLFNNKEDANEQITAQRNGIYAIAYAFITGKLDAAKYLITKYKLDPTKDTNDFTTSYQRGFIGFGYQSPKKNNFINIIQCVLMQGDLEIIRYLNDEFNAITIMNQHYRNQHGHYYSGDERRQDDKYNKGILFYTATSGNVELLQYLLDNDCEEYLTLDVLCEAAIVHHWPFLTKLYELINFDDYEDELENDGGYIALLSPMIYDETTPIELIDELLQRCGDINSLEFDHGDGMTVLSIVLFTVDCANLPLLKHLVMKYDVDLGDYSPNYSLNIFHYIAELGDKFTPEFLNFVLKHHPHPQSINDIDNAYEIFGFLATPLDLAIHDDNLPCVVELLKHVNRINIEPCDKYGHDSVEQLYLEIQREIKQGIVNEEYQCYPDFWEYSHSQKRELCPFQCSAKSKDAQIFKALVNASKQSTSKKLTNAKIGQLMKVATVHNNIDLIQHLFDQYNGKIICNNDHFNLLKLAFETNEANHDTIKFLINTKLFNLESTLELDVYSENKTKSTILHDAACYGLEILKLLVENGAKIHALDHNGDNIISILRKKHQPEECIQYFIDLGVKNVN